MRSCTVQAGATARMAPQGAASWAISALFAAAVLLSVAQADPDCYAPDAAVLYRANTSECTPGYWCPNLNTSDPSTWMAICTPSVECQQLRLNSQFCPGPQGEYEPYPCPQGHYCPDAATVRQCPANHYCPVGTVHPIPCNGFALCPAGTVRQTQIIPVVTVAGFDILALLLIFAYQRYNRRERQRHRQKAVAYASPPWTRLLYPYSSSGRAALTAHDAVAHVLSTIRAARNSSSRLRLIFRNLQYSTSSGTQLLHSASGQFPTDNLTAIMGPSGAGKTTLLRCVLGQWTPTAGTVALESAGDTSSSSSSLPASSATAHSWTGRGVVGYVPQHTVLFSMLTVRENIFHAALVNLPHSHFGRRDIAAFVDAILATLSLSRVADNVVGDGVRHIGVSGGESKRCSVGVALAAAPLILILDEPTSGLDSSSALSLVQLLYQLSRSGLTVAAVIHQPRPEVFRLFDHLVLLRPVGHVLYSGPRTGVHHALQAQGLVCGSDSALLAAAQASETAVNMADVLIDVSSRQPSGGAAAAHQHVQKAVNDDGGGGDVPMLLPNNSTLSAVSTTAASAPRPKAANTPMRYPGMLAQTVWCFQRSLLEQYRDYVNLFVEVFIALLAGGLMGASSSADDRIYQGLLQGPQSLQSPAPQNFAVLQQGFFVGLSISVIASPAAVKVFGTELQQFWREASAGHSRAAYMLGKFLAMLPRLTLSAIHFSSIFYVLVRPRIAYGQFFALVWVYFYCTFAVAAMISILFYKTNTALVAVIITMALTSPNGYQPSLHDLADSGLRNLWGIFYTRWTTGAYAAGEMTHWRNIFDVPLSLSETGFDLTAPIVQVAYAAAIGTFLHLVVFVVLERSFRLYRRPPNAAGRGWLCCRRKHSTMGKYDKLADEAEA